MGVFGSADNINDDASDTPAPVDLVVDTVEQRCTASAVVTPGTYHTCTLLSGGQVARFGLSDDAQLGQGNTGQLRDDPSEFGASVSIVNLSAGGVQQLGELVRLAADVGNLSIVALGTERAAKAVVLVLAAAVAAAAVAPSVVAAAAVAAAGGAVAVVAVLVVLVVLGDQGGLVVLAALEEALAVPAVPAAPAAPTAQVAWAAAAALVDDAGDALRPCSDAWSVTGAHGAVHRWRNGAGHAHGVSRTVCWAHHWTNGDVNVGRNGSIDGSGYTFWHGGTDGSVNAGRDGSFDDSGYTYWHGSRVSCAFRWAHRRPDPCADRWRYCWRYRWHHRYCYRWRDRCRDPWRDRWRDCWRDRWRHC
ncbi:hypothetical protein JKP88DRAFT_349390 [Tribonema minus]|uniref:Uncharacterized protein n=1 Tax=Tribonema minus TaxID=303371 RepID=A0A835YSV2_9STRA|nr:hypothetical protein JKP88DRAFT_349390 [Tribonema minus]